MRSYNIYSTESFKKCLKHLAKKYRHIGEDVDEILEVLREAPDAGDAIPGYGRRVWKVRVKSSDIRKGKRSGFRLIYFWEHGKRNL